MSRVDYDGLLYFQQKMKYYVSEHGGGSQRKVDLSDDLSGTYNLDANKLYILPDMNAISSQAMRINLNDAPAGNVGKWQFIVHVSTSIPLNISGVQFASLPAYVAGSVYLFEVIADNNKKYGSFRALSQPDTYYLYNSRYSVPTCDENTGGWNFNGVGIFNGTTQRISIVASNDATDPNSVKMAAYRDNSGNRYGNTISTKQRIPFKALYDAGYRSINFKVRGNPVNANANFYFIATKNIYAVNTNVATSAIQSSMESAFPDSVNMKYNNPASVYTTHSLSIKQIVDAGITEGFVAVFHHADASGTFNGFVSAVYADYTEAVSE